MNLVSDNTTHYISEVSDIIDRYDAFILDIWGVIHDGFNPYPKVVSCVNKLLALNKKVIFLSNAPRPGHLMIKKIQDFGILCLEKDILSSGDVVREQLKTFSDPIFSTLEKLCYHLGAARNQDILAGIELELTEDVTEAGFILLTAFADEEEGLEQYDSILEQGAYHRIPAICANPDTIVIHGNKLRYCAGVFAEKYENLGGQVYYYGKPHATVFDVILTKLKQQGVTDKKRILMVGDTLITDILGAKQAGIDSALTITGNVSVYLAENRSRGLPDKVLLEALFKERNIYPTWVMPGLF